MGGNYAIDAGLQAKDGHVNSIGVTLKQLQRFARWALKIATAEAQLASELAEALKRAEEIEDPLGRYIYQARSRYRQTCQSDRSKAGKSIERELERSYVDATKLGFDGPYKLWVLLMQWGKSPARLKEEREAASLTTGPPA